MLSMLLEIPNSLMLEISLLSLNPGLMVVRDVFLERLWMNTCHTHVPGCLSLFHYKQLRSSNMNLEDTESADNVIKNKSSSESLEEKENVVSYCCVSLEAL